MRRVMLSLTPPSELGGCRRSQRSLLLFPAPFSLTQVAGASVLVSVVGIRFGRRHRRRLQWSSLLL